MIVCICRSVSDRAVEAAIQAGARDVATIAQATGAGSDCGCCHEELEARASAYPGAAPHGAAPSHRDAPCCATPCPGCPRANTGRPRAA